MGLLWAKVPRQNRECRICSVLYGARCPAYIPPGIKRGLHSRLFMQLDNFAQQTKCPASLSAALQALWYAKKGDWKKAHEIVQDADDIDSAWVHAYLHRQEGDLSNARYWYRRSQQPEFTASLSQEWEYITQELLEKAAQIKI